jgi:hypothetical protein
VRVVLEIWHRIHVDGKVAGYWQERGLEMHPLLSALDEEARPRTWVAEVCENSKLWSELKNSAGIESFYVNTLYTDQERLAAEWCILRVAAVFRPAEPTGGYWSPKYYEDRCRECGSGWSQITAFRFSREPRMKAESLASMGGDELFVTKELLRNFERAGFRGFYTWPVLVGKEGREVEGLKQLLVEAVAEPAIADDLVEHEHYYYGDCPTCGQRWHIYYTRGMLPLRREALRTDLDFQLTNEWFGSGAAARREILVSHRVTELILKKKWKGADLVPILAV